MADKSDNSTTRKKGAPRTVKSFTDPGELLAAAQEEALSEWLKSRSLGFAGDVQTRLKMQTQWLKAQNVPYEGLQPDVEKKAARLAARVVALYREVETFVEANSGEGGRASGINELDLFLQGAHHGAQVLGNFKQSSPKNWTSLKVFVANVGAPQWVEKNKTWQLQKCKTMDRLVTAAILSGMLKKSDANTAINNPRAREGALVSDVRNLLSSKLRKVIAKYLGISPKQLKLVRLISG